MTAAPSDNLVSSVRRSLTLKYVTSLVLLGLLATLAFALLNDLIRIKQADGPQINIAGRQRMLSQRIAFLATQLTHSRSLKEYEVSHKALESAVHQMTASHDALLNGSESLQIRAGMKQNLREKYLGVGKLDEQVRIYLENAKRVLAVPYNRIDATSLEIQEIVTAASSGLLEDLDEAVNLYERNSSERNRSLRWLETFVWLATLASLCGEAFFIFQPMVNSLCQHLQTLADKNALLVEKDKRIGLLMDSGSDGLLPVSLSGEIETGTTSQIAAWFGDYGEGMRFWDLLSKDESAREDLRLGYEQIVDGILPFDVAVDQAVSTLKVGPRTFSIEYREVREQGKRTGMLLVVSDITEALALAQAEGETQEFKDILASILNDQNGFKNFIDETSAQLEIAQRNSHAPEKLTRCLHTIKGTASIYGFRLFASKVHAAEEIILQGEEGAPVVQDLIGHWQTQVARFSSIFRSDDISITRDEHALFLEKLSALQPGTSLLAETNRWKYESCEKRLDYLARSAEDLAARFGKKLRVQTAVTCHLRLDGTRFGPLWAVLPHLLRNAIDHGIEPSHIRTAAGKSEYGNIELVCKILHGKIYLSISDDGPGIDWDSLAAKAEELGIDCHKAEALTDILFLDGVSTRNRANEMAGRGVGLSAVKDTILSLDGDLEVRSRRGQGTTFLIQVPLPHDAEYEDLWNPVSSEMQVSAFSI